jgi:crotonobetainyl-CoA:carnitine CoA-transferase CaiB-like acyl-CoA transferase
MTRAAESLRVVDFGLGFSAAVIAKQFADLGARVARIEPEGGDPFHDLYPAHRLWRRRESIHPSERAEELLEQADVCIVGGEDFPGAAPARAARALAARHPRLVVLDLVGYPGNTARPRPAVDLLVQARTGILYEQYSHRPIATSLPLAGYGCALQGLIGAWVALVERERSGAGQVVTASLAAGAAMFWGPFWMRAERPDPGFEGITPRDVRQLIVRCSGDEYVQLTLGVPGALAKVYRSLGIPHPADPGDRGMPSAARGPANFYGDFDLLNEYARRHTRASLVHALREAGVPAEAVLPPGECWSDEQARINRIVDRDESGWSVVGNPLSFEPSPGARPCPAAGGSPAARAAPLAGIRVVDFGIFVAGPYASKLLADYGADVIQVEPPSGRATLSGERTIVSANHGKRSICIDAKAARGRAVVERLCAGADVVLHNFRPGVSARLGLDRESLRRLNPSLVTLETTAYGPSGPKAHAPGFDMVMQAHCGLEYRAGGDGNPPLCCRSPLVDFATGAMGAVGLLIGLYERSKTGAGVAVETNLLSVGAHMMCEVVRGPGGVWEGPMVLDRSQTGFHPAESLYRTADGWIALAARSPAMISALAECLGVDLPRDRRAWNGAERDTLAARIATRASGELLAELDRRGVWAEACAADAWEAALQEPIVRTLHDERYGEVVHCIGALVQLSRSITPSAARLCMEPGEDSVEILKEIGIPGEEIAGLLAGGAVVDRKSRRAA